MTEIRSTFANVNDEPNQLDLRSKFSTANDYESFIVDVKSEWARIRDFERMLASQVVDCEEIKNFIFSITYYTLVEEALYKVLNFSRGDVESDYAIKLTQCVQHICDEFLNTEPFEKVFDRLEKIKLSANLAMDKRSE